MFSFFAAAGIAAINSGVVPIQDVRIGDDGETTRVEVVCGGPCDAEPLGEQEFLITWASADFRVDLGTKSKNLNALSLTSAPYGTALKVAANTAPRAVRVNRCGPQRLCFDFDFDAPASETPLDRGSKPEMTIAQMSANLERLMEKVGMEPPQPKVYASRMSSSAATLR